MKDQEIDKMFSDGLRDQETTPPASIWQGIESKLDEEKTIPFKRKNNLYVWMIAACLTLALGISLKMFLFQDNSAEKTPTQIAQLEDKLINDKETSISEDLIPVEKESKEVPVLLTTNQPSKIKEVQKKQTETKPIIQAKDTEREDMIVPSQELKLVTAVEIDDMEQEPNELATVEVAPIQPLVNIIEHEEVMYAEVKKEPKKKQTIFTNILNTLSDNLNPSSKAVRFSSDEEGTISVDLFNSIAKTRR